MTRTRFIVAAFAGLATAAAPAAAEAVPVVGPPTVAPAAPTGANGWYTAPVTVTWDVVAPAAHTAAGCGALVPDNDANDTTSRYVLTLTADTTGVTPSCTVTDPSDQSSGTAATPAAIKIDQTPPTAAATLPAPPANGWYTTPVPVTGVGADATSGPATCTSATYSGPDSAAATVQSTCTNTAGLASTATSAPFAYDATPPQLSGVGASVVGDAISVGWTATDAIAVAVTVTRTAAGGAPVQVYAGTGSSVVDAQVTRDVSSTYTVTAIDPAGHRTAVSTAQVKVPPAAMPVGPDPAGDPKPGPLPVTPAVPQPAAALGTATPAAPTATAAPQRTAASPIRPPSGAALTGPPVLKWPAVKRATYYNVQLFRGSKKLRTAWPSVPTLVLKRTWRHNGRSQRLVAGTYTWFVWPGYGKRSAKRYGDRVVRATFVIR